MSILGEGLGWFAHVVGSAVGGVTLAPVNSLAGAIADAVASLLVDLGTAWVKLGTPDIAVADGGPSSTTSFLQGELQWLVLWCAVLALIVGGARLAITQRAEPARDVLRGLITLAVVSGCGVAVIGLAVSASDQLARSIIDDATAGVGFGKSLGAMLRLGGPALAPVLVIVFGLAAIVVSIIQIGLIVFRAGMLVLLAGTLPLAASFTSTQTGREWFRKYCGWTLALVAYKPAAALCYAAAFRLLGSGELAADGALSLLVGLALMVMAIVALPALLRFVVPAVGALSTGRGGAGSMVMGAAMTMAMPKGARDVAPAGGATGPMVAGRSPSGPSGAAATGGASGAAQTGAAAAGPAVAVAAAAGAAQQGVKAAAGHAAAPSTNGGPDGSK